MIADRLAALGVPVTLAKTFVALVFLLIAGLLAALFPGAPWLPPVLAFVAAVAALIDPNAGHGTALG